MPLAARLIVYDSNKKPLAGPIPVQDVEFRDLKGSLVNEFEHQVYTIQKDYFYSLMYGVDFVRRHVPLRIVKPIDKLSVQLMGFLVKGTFLPQVEIRWYEFQKDTHKEVEYFRMTLEHVRLNSIHTLLPNVKDPCFEKYDHLESITFCYQKITWLYIKGYLVYTDIWDNGFYADEEEMGSSSNEEDSLESQEAVIDDKLTLKFTSGVFEEPEDGFQFDKNVTVRFTFEANRKPNYNENKVYAKLYAVYNDKTEDLSQINEGRLVAENSWSTEFKLKKPQSYINDTNRKPDAVVEYYAEIENAAAGGNYKSESIKVPKKDSAKPEFVEVYFENENGERIERAKKNQKVKLVVSTKNMVGKKVEIDLSDGTIDFIYNGQIMENDVLKDLEITADVMKIELLTHAQEKK